MANTCGTALLSAVREQRSTDLYHVAQQKFWRVDTSLDWSGFPDKTCFPFSRAGNHFCGYGEYEALSCTQQKLLAWQLHAAEISNILYGERAALTLAAQILPTCDSGRDQLFLASQVADEARHVEFFASYLRALRAENRRPSRVLTEYLQAVMQQAQLAQKQIACQLVLEPLAMLRFRELRVVTRVSLLRQALNYIARDEARHTCFGREYLLHHLDALSAVRKQATVNQISHQLQRLATDLQLQLDIGQDWGFRPARLRQHLQQRRCSNVAVNRQFQHCLQSLRSLMAGHRVH